MTNEKDNKNKELIVSLIRGIRSMINARDYAIETERNEDIALSVVLETSEDENCYVKITNAWPESITLNARMFSEKAFDSAICAQVLKGAVKLGKILIYSSPTFHSASEIKNKNNFCSKLCIKYENVGEYVCNQNKSNFSGETFDDYEIKFLDKNIIFEKDFSYLLSSFSEQLAEKAKVGSEKTKQAYRMYPYGGFFKQGAHPEEIEECFFQIVLENSKPTIRILRAKKVFANMPKNIDADFLEAEVETQKFSLYDDFLNGKCKISLINKSSEESGFYKSDSVQHISDSDLIKIHFTKEKER